MLDMRGSCGRSMWKMCCDCASGILPISFKICSPSAIGSTTFFLVLGVFLMFVWVSMTTLKKLGRKFG